MAISLAMDARHPAQTQVDGRALRHHPLFRDLSPEEIAILLSHNHVLSCRKGQTILYEGTRPTGLFFLLRGKAKVFKKGLWNEEQIVRLAGPGDLITLRALGGTPHYKVSAAALVDSEILFVDLDDFFSVLKSNAAFAFKVTRLLALELDAAETRLRDFAQKNVRQRLAGFLLQLVCGGNGETAGSVDLPLSRGELANFLGTATETVVRLLAEFRDKGLIALKGRHILILDRGRLGKVASPDQASISYLTNINPTADAGH